MRREENVHELHAASTMKDCEPRGGIKPESSAISDLNPRGVPSIDEMSAKFHCRISPASYGNIKFVCKFQDAHVMRNARVCILRIRMHACRHKQCACEHPMHSF